MDVVRFNLPLKTGEPAYVRVFIFPDKLSMHTFRRGQVAANPTMFESEGRIRFEAEASAYTALQKRNGRWRKVNRKGQVLFHAGYIGAGVVAHEMTHMALYNVAQRGPKRCFHLTGRDDERLAAMVGHLCVGFWRHYWKNEKRIKRAQRLQAAAEAGK